VSNNITFFLSVFLSFFFPCVVLNSYNTISCLLLRYYIVLTPNSPCTKNVNLMLLIFCIFSVSSLCYSLSVIGIGHAYRTWMQMHVCAGHGCELASTQRETHIGLHENWY
jgi:hypothetical protein